MMISALRSFSVNWPTWRCSFSFSSVSGSRSDWRPRWRGFSASKMPAGAFPPPARQMRGIQTLPAKQCPDSTRSGGGRISLFENTDLVLDGKRTTLGLGHDLGIRPRRGARRGARFGWRCTMLRLATLAFASFRGSQTPRRKNNTKRIPVHLYPFPSRPAH